MQVCRNQIKSLLAHIYKTDPTRKRFVFCFIISFSSLYLHIKIKCEIFVSTAEF